MYNSATKIELFLFNQHIIMVTILITNVRLAINLLLIYQQNSVIHRR